MRVAKGKSKTKTTKAVLKTAADVREYVQRARAQRAAAEERQTRAESREGVSRRHNPLAAIQRTGGNDLVDIMVGRDRAPDWKKRTVKYFSALALKKEDPEAGTEALMELRRESRQMSDVQKRAEAREAIEILRAAGLSEVQIRRTASTLSDAAGATLLAKPFLAEVFTIVEQYGDARRLLRNVPMDGKELDLKSIATKPTVGWIDELGRIAETGMDFAPDQKLTTYKAGGIISWSTEIREDEAIASLPLITQGLGEQIGLFEDTLAFLADGTSDYKGMTGLLNAAYNVVQMASGKTSFTQITAEDLRLLRDSVSTSSQRGAVYGIHRTVFSYIEGLRDTNGQYLVKRPTDESNGKFTIWNFPVEILEAMPALSASAISKRYVWFGNPQHALWGQRRGITMDQATEAVLSDENGVVTFNSYQQDGALLRLTERIGLKIPTPNTKRFAALRTAAS